PRGRRTSRAACPIGRYAAKVGLGGRTLGGARTAMIDPDTGATDGAGGTIHADAELPRTLFRAFQASSLPMFVLDPDGTIVWFNKASIEMVGDLVGLHFTALVAPASTETVR